MTGTLREDLCSFLIISHWVLLRMRIFSDESCRENQNTRFIFNNFFWTSCRLWDKVEKYCRVWQATDDNVIRRIRIACWIPKDPHSKYVILTAFQQQQWLHERASVLPHCLSCFINIYSNAFPWLKALFLQSVGFRYWHFVISGFKCYANHSYRPHSIQLRSFHFLVWATVEN